MKRALYNIFALRLRDKVKRCYTGQLATTIFLRNNVARKTPCNVIPGTIFRVTFDLATRCDFLNPSQKLATCCQHRCAKNRCCKLSRKIQPLRTLSMSFWMGVLESAKNFSLISLLTVRNLSNSQQPVRSHPDVI